jgi:hypothetical protein
MKRSLQALTGSHSALTFQKSAHWADLESVISDRLKAMATTIFPSRAARLSDQSSLYILAVHKADRQKSGMRLSWSAPQQLSPSESYSRAHQKTA